ncbi:Hsp20/alpha crystallin family protein [Krasilnikovia sp. M28-CT-15]|uniref:Hsp20/alpha crystallin family protein n=1 Tax=Krasilnikovia sp. M28-CT-15 TaxID=3373540 RepID=UPI00399D08EB
MRSHLRRVGPGTTSWSRTTSTTAHLLSATKCSLDGAQMWSVRGLRPPGTPTHPASQDYRVQPSASIGIIANWHHCQCRHPRNRCAAVSQGRRGCVMVTPGSDGPDHQQLLPRPGGRLGVLRCQTRRVGQFEFMVTLPGDIDPHKVEASLHDGVLTVRLGRPPRASLADRGQGDLSLLGQVLLEPVGLSGRASRRLAALHRGDRVIARGSPRPPLRRPQTVTATRIRTRRSRGSTNVADVRSTYPYRWSAIRQRSAATPARIGSTANRPGRAMRGRINGANGSLRPPGQRFAERERADGSQWDGAAR